MQSSSNEKKFTSMLDSSIFVTCYYIPFCYTTIFVIKKKLKKFYNAYFIACNAHLCLYYNRLVTVFVVVKSLNFRHKPIVFLLVKIKLIYDCTLPSKAKSHILFKEQMRSPKCTFNDCLSIQQMV